MRRDPPGDPSTPDVLPAPGTVVGKRTRARVRSNLPWKFLLLFASGLLVLVSLSAILLDLRLKSGWTTVITLLFATWVIVYLLASYKSHRSIYLFATAYLISLAVFHLGQVLADGVGWFDLNSLHRGYMAPWHERAGWYILLSFGCFGVGLASAIKGGVKLSPADPIDSRKMDDNMRSVYWIGVALLCASLASLVLLVGSVGNIFRFSRAEIFSGVGDTRGFGFFLLVAPSAMVLMVTGARSRLQKRLAYPLAALMVLFILFLGYRSSALFPALVGAIIWVKTGRRIPPMVAGAAIMVVLIAIPTVSTLRSLGAYKDLSGKDLSHSIEQSDIQEVFLQLGGTSTIVANVLRWVPKEDPYRYGQSYLLALRNAIPNIGLQIGESERKQLQKKGLVTKESVRLMNPGDWYIYKTNPYLFEVGGGSGFSSIAEAYLNFGLPGVLAYFLLLGYLLERLDQADLRSSRRLMIFSGAMLWPLLKTVRNVSGVFFKPVVFILVSIAIWKLIFIWNSRVR